MSSLTSLPTRTTNTSSTTTTPLNPTDLSTLQTWNQAFTTLPLPTIRTLETQLRSAIDSNRTQLRTLVGASYRELLNTADLIVEMERECRGLEGRVGGLGRMCSITQHSLPSRDGTAGRRVGLSEGKEVGLDGGLDEGRRRRRRREERMVRIKILKSAVGVVGRIVKRKEGGDALVAGKVLVLARLVLKSVAPEGGEEEEVLEGLRKRVTMLRKRVLSFVERTLGRQGVEKEVVLITLCAYALVSSATPKEVLRYFLQTRLEQLEVSSEECTPQKVEEVVDAYGQTLLDARELFPRRFGDALGPLSATALVQDAQVRALPELSLDISESWLSEDVRTFTPWLRHEQLTTVEVGDGLSHWARQAQECLLQAVKDCVSAQTDELEVLKIRSIVLAKYIALVGRVRGAVDAAAIHRVRTVLMDRVVELAVQTAQDDVLAGVDITETDGQTQQQTPIWQLAENNLNLTRGAMGFRQQVLDHRYGRDAKMTQVTQRLDAWLSRVQSLWKTIDEMRSTKWDDDLTDDLDDLPDGGTLQEALNKRDPERLQAALREATSKALRRCHERVTEASQTKDAAGSILRIQRELDGRQHAIYEAMSISNDELADNEVVGNMQRHIASKAVKSALLQYAKSIRRPGRTSTLLWEGSPPLPNQPSPATFKLLLTLHRAMSDAGTDLWTPAAVKAVKELLLKGLAAEIVVSLEASTEPAMLTNGHSVLEKGKNATDEESAQQQDEQGEEHPRRDDPEAEAKHAANLTQLLFDMLYVQRIAKADQDGTSGSDAASYAVLVELHQKSGVDEAGQQRLRKSASDYWKKTYLLFGLLTT